MPDGIRRRIALASTLAEIRAVLAEVAVYDGPDRKVVAVEAESLWMLIGAAPL